MTVLRDTVKKKTGRPPGMIYPAAFSVAPPRAKDCICGKHMLKKQNEGTCLWCGYGSATVNFYGRRFS